ncbi:MAG TPA: flagellar basal body L-ring protein FlgH [Polyangiaceae bacterium]
MKHVRRLLFVLGLFGAGCGPAHIAPFTPKERKYEAAKYAATQKQYRPATGSIYSEAQAGYLEDTRALRVGDIVLIRINEYADAEGDASTELDKSTSRNAGVEAFMALMPKLQRENPNLNPSQLISMASEYDFDAEGKTKRAGSLNGTIGVQVKQELPNGDLFVEGTKVVMINHEEYHLYISGVLRTTDIQPDNSVASSLLADARVEYTGRGDLNDTVERGWLTKALDAINPF